MIPKQMNRMMILQQITKMNILKIKTNYQVKKVFKKMMTIKKLMRIMKNNSKTIQFWKEFFLRRKIILCTIFSTFMKI